MLQNIRQTFFDHFEERKTIPSTLWNFDLIPEFINPTLIAQGYLIPAHPPSQNLKWNTRNSPQTTDRILEVLPHI